MATPGLMSVQVEDADGEITSIDFPFTNTTDLLANIVTWATNILSKLDLVLDAKMNKVKLCISLPLPGGVKTAAVAGAEIERTALLSYMAAGSSNSYGQDLAGFAYAKFIGNAVNTSDADVAAFIAAVEGTTAATSVTDRYGDDLVALRSARKTFRKHRKSTARA